ncbi:MAG: hypothetical protein IH917_03870, partial [Acidobacteria bacterium]|nr:hypothetical protein [Acidobacteriota bacterium]
MKMTKITILPLATLAILLISHGMLWAVQDLPAPDDVAAPPEDAQKSDSGLSSRVLVKGTGSEHPSATSTVTVHYTG